MCRFAHLRLSGCFFEGPGDGFVDLAVAHVMDDICVLMHRLVMGCHNQGDPFALDDGAHQGEQIFAGGRVEFAGWFVGDEDGRT